MSIKSDTDFLNPVDCLNLNFEQSLNIIKTKIGSKNLNRALDIKKLYPSPVSDYNNTSWCKTLKIIGINPIIAKSYWNIVKYSLSFPEQGIHIMPLFETGDGSLYVQNSWELNNDFLDENLFKYGYKTPQQQLKLIVNVLHAIGKIVGFDIAAHCDNFSKIVLLNPKLFEWVKLNENKTAQIPYEDIDYNDLYIQVQNIIIETLNVSDDIFDLPEKQREEIIFPKSINEFERRMELRQAIRKAGFEPIPVVEHAPSRPVLFEKIENNDGESWASFKVENKDKSAKIFGSVTPYKLYYTDKFGYPIENKFLVQSWDYFSQKVNEFQDKYNFDFLRADMAHNQISHSHKNPKKDCACPELWSYVKNNIQERKPYFATIAEAFYSTYYIDGISDMLNKEFDIVLGDMNFKNLDRNYTNFIDDYINPFRQNFSFYPSVTIFTNDGDLEIHNKFFQSNKQNLLRCFISLFLNLPSYMGMGFELRDINPENRFNYSHDYIKKQKKDYQFGKNIEFFKKFCKIRKKYIEFKNIIDNCKSELLYSKNDVNCICFKYVDEGKSYLFIANMEECENIIEIEGIYKDLKLIFTFDENIKAQSSNGVIFINIGSLEFAIYEYK